LANQAVTKQMDALQIVADVEWSAPTSGLMSTSLSAYAYSKHRATPFNYFWKTHPQILDDLIRETPKYRAMVDAGATDASVITVLRGNTAFLTSLQAQKIRLESGFAAIDPRTGFVKAWVGGRDFEVDKYDHVAQAKRQPGSTFKPFVYGAALEKGLKPDQRYYDKPVEIRLSGGGVWRPTDLGSPTGRLMTMEEGLIHSKNTITAQVMQDVGPQKVAALARSMGVTGSPIDPVPSLALGTSPVSLLEMVSSYATIAAVGEYRKPLLITRITDKRGNVLAEFTSENDRVMDKDNAVVLLDMMRGVINQGTGTGIRQTFGIRADVAGKTGTTQNNTDGWFILMHPHLVAGAWVGFNDSRITMRSEYWGQGAHNALYLVGDFFRLALNSRAVSSNVAFPRRPSSSIFGPIIDRVYDWLDRERGIDRPIPEEQPVETQDTPGPQPEKKSIGQEVDHVIDEIKKADEFIKQQTEQLKKLQRETGKDEERDREPGGG